MKVYVASSWRNLIQPGIVQALRRCGHEVYDFRENGFGWRQVDEYWETWDNETYRDVLQTSPTARAGYKRDIDALDGADACVLVMPCGRSSFWELGYAHAKGKRCYVLTLGKMEPELMIADCVILTSIEEMFDVFLGVGKKPEDIGK